MKKIAIIGSGDLGQLIAHHSEACGYTVAGFFDDFREPGAMVKGYPVLGKTENAESDFKKGIYHELMCGIGYKHMGFRKAIFERFSATIPFARVIHPSAYIDRSVRTGSGIIVFPGCVIDCHAALGDNVLLNTGCIVAHDTSVGSHSFLSPAVHLAGFVRIGESCNIGIGTNVIDNIAISGNIQTGAGSVVVKNLTEQGLYVGIPARKIK